MLPRSPLPLIAVAAVVLLAGCSSTESNAKSGDVPLVEAGKLTDCTGLPYAPFEVEKDGKVVGFDMDLMDLVAKELNVEHVPIDTPFDGIESGENFNANKCDLAAAGMTITAERAKKFDFSDPYFDASQALITKKGAGYKDLAALKGKKLGVQQSTTGEEYAKKNGEGVELVQFEDSGLQLAALASGKVDAVINDNGLLFEHARQHPEFEVTTEFETGEQYGIGVKKGNKALLKVINDVLAKAKKDGTYDEIYKKWFPAAG